MKIAAVCAEYNPFHNGHKAQLDIIRNELGATHIIALMSGNFVQRGGVAIADKKQRAFTAANNGADLVLQLPFVYASQTAEMFATGAAGIINAILPDIMCFGCDTDKFDDMLTAAKAMNKESAQFKINLRRNLVEGRQYPAARLKAAEAETGTDLSFLTKPNNILALEYIRAMLASGSPVKLTPTRLVNEDNILSASEIREMLYKGSPEAEKYMPENAYAEIKNEKLRSLDEYAMIIKAKLVTTPRPLLAHSAECDDALINRMLGFIDCLNSGIDSFTDEVSGKSITKSKVRRALVNIMLSYSSEQLVFYKLRSLRSIRVLAANERGRELISSANKKGIVRLYPNTNKAFAQLNEFDKMVALTENKAENLYSVFDAAHDRDFKSSPSII